MNEQQQEGLLNHALASVFTGLGILLGAGRITNAKHQQILGLLGDLTKSNGVGPDASSSSDVPGLDKKLRSDVKTETSVVDHAGALGGSSSSFKIICPWWYSGLKCRMYDMGNCKMAHEDIPGAKYDPLICPFWVDNERCRKTAKECRFAHYWAKHNMVAPSPKSSKKPKNDQGANDSNGWASSLNQTAGSVPKYQAPRPRVDHDAPRDRVSRLWGEDAKVKDSSDTDIFNELKDVPQSGEHETSDDWGNGDGWNDSAAQVPTGWNDSAAQVPTGWDDDRAPSTTLNDNSSW